VGDFNMKRLMWVSYQLLCDGSPFAKGDRHLLSGKTFLLELLE